MPHLERKIGKEKTLALLLTQVQGSSVMDGIDHLRNFLLSAELFSGEFVSYIGLALFLYLHNTSGLRGFQNGIFHVKEGYKFDPMRIDVAAVFAMC